MWVKYRTPSRNVSTRGVALLVGKFIYPGTRCRVHLVSVHNHTQVVEGVVVHCRYLPETATVHEVGIKFDHLIDVEMFHRGATRFRVLFADDDSAVHKLVQRLLKDMNVELTFATNGSEAVEKAQHNVYDVILMDVEMPEMDGATAVSKLREQGYMRPVVAVTAHTDDKSKQKCIQSGFNFVLNKPLTHEALHNAIVSQRENPIISSLLHDRNLAEVIDAFVAELPDRVRDLECAFAQNDRDTLEKVARRLKGEAGAYGFEVITDAAGELENEIRAGKDFSDLRDKLNNVVRLALAARPVSLQCADPKADASENEEHTADEAKVTASA